MYDRATSEEVLAFLAFAVNMSREPKHLREFYDKNSDIVALLTDDDKETLRGVYSETLQRLRKAS